MTFFSSSSARISYPLIAIVASATVQASEVKVVINSDFPGGNIIVQSTDKNKVRLAPDIRDTTTDWFYWYFAAEASKPGPVEFIFTGARIGNRGPAYSLDQGKTWQWLGTENVTYSVRGGSPDETFVFNFTEPNQKVLFAQGFPYVQTHLDEFLAKNAGNKHLVKTELTKSNGGRSVELLQVGDPSKMPVLIGARSHACEALASYVLEGFVSEAMSDTHAGETFRKKYVLYAIPFIDKDGVEKGDQGKNRGPHDHNRDYGTNPIYAEIKALQKLANEKNVQIAIDFHCPYLKGDVHEAYHWLGLKVPHIADNITELNSWIGEERPGYANIALNFLSKLPAEPKTENVPFSWHFAYQPNNLLGVTLEAPYAQAKTPDEARAYGQGLLRAFVRTEFLGPDAQGNRGKYSHGKLVEFGKELTPLLGKPDEAIPLAQTYLNDSEATGPFKAQAHLSLHTVELRRANHAKALEHLEAVINAPDSTSAQKSQALVHRITVLSRTPQVDSADVEAAAKALEDFSFATPLNRSSGFRDAAGYFFKAQLDDKALEYSEKRLKVCSDWEKGSTYLQRAEIYDRLNEPGKALDERKKALAFLEEKLLPAPQGKSVHVGMMTGQYFDTLLLLPDATKEAKIRAAKFVVDYPTLPVGLKERVTQWLSENQ